MQQNWQKLVCSLWIVGLLGWLGASTVPLAQAISLPPVYRQAPSDPPVYKLALPLVAVAPPPATIDQVTESVQVANNGGIWLLPAEIAALPTTGPAWLQMKGAADGPSGLPTLNDQDSDANVNYLAKALVFARTSDGMYRDQVASALRTLTMNNTEDGGRTLALGRELVAYVIAADLIDLKTYDPDLDMQFRAKLRTLLTKNLENMTLQTTHEVRPNNWGTHAGASRAAIAAYLGDRAELDRVWLIFRGYLGDRSAYSSFEYGDLDWQTDPALPVPINPVGAQKQGYNLDGALPEEMRRGGPFQWPPAETGYAWEALQGAIVQAQLLHRAGYPAWEWQDRALLRAVLFLQRIGWPADGDDGWQPWLINHAYRAEILPALNPALPGKNMGWTNWTHMSYTTSPTLTPTLTPVPPTDTPTSTPLPPSPTPTPLPPTATWTPPPSPTQPTTNQPPLVNAGEDQRITQPNSVTLRGRATDDGRPDSTAALVYIWHKVSGPGTVVLSNSNATETTATFSAAGAYVVRLIVSDGELSARDEVQITVDPAVLPSATPTLLQTPPPPTETPTPPPPTATHTPDPTATPTPIPPTSTPASVNQAPLVQAGADQGLTLPVNRAELTGSASDDTLPDPTVPMAYSWLKVGGPGAVVFENPNSAQTAATFATPGVYLLRLIVNDGLLSASDDLQVVVNPAPSDHQAPVVDAGADQSITWPANQISLLGSATDDSLPNPPALLIYAWSKVNGPGAVSFGSVNAPSTTAAFSQPGLYALRLIASDGALSASDDVQITVNPNSPITLTFTPTDDSGITPGVLTGGGTAKSYRVRSGVPEYRIYLKFAVTGVSGPVESAKLRLYVIDGSNRGGAFYAVANHLLNSADAWNENNLTWTNAPLMTGDPLHTLGAVTLGTWVEVDVTAAITGDGIYSFAAKSTSTDSAYYSAKEGLAPPLLLITMTSGNE